VWKQMQSVNEWKFNFYSIWLINNNNVVFNNPQMVFKMILQIEMGTQIFYMIYSLCILLNCQLVFHVNVCWSKQTSKFKSSSFYIGWKHVKVGQKISLPKTHLKIWHFFTKHKKVDWKVFYLSFWKHACLHWIYSKLSTKFEKISIIRVGNK
jgi:hypothetical protein